MARPRRKVYYEVWGTDAAGEEVAYEKVYKSGGWCSGGYWHPRTFNGARRLARRLAQQHGGTGHIRRVWRHRGKVLGMEWSVGDGEA